MTHLSHSSICSITPSYKQKMHKEDDDSKSESILSPLHDSQTLDLYKICKGPEIGNEALCWELSSAKVGHGIQELRDDDLSTFWQSSGQMPHKIKILFHKKQAIAQIAIYVDYNRDESYTPAMICIKSLNAMNDYRVVCTRVLQNPSGWMVFTTNNLKSKKILIEILSSQDDGKDTHIRQIKIFAPFINNYCKYNGSIYSSIISSLDSKLNSKESAKMGKKIEMEKQLQRSSFNSKQFLQFSRFR